jgi:large subunit ribosomal protein L4
VVGKPWKKGTGNARAGSRRSPLWVGGGLLSDQTTYCFKRLIKKERRFILSALF